VNGSPKPARRTTSRRAVPLPEHTGADRRVATRYRLALGVRYVVENRYGGVAATGFEQKVDLSTSCVRFTTGSSLEPGLRLKLFIDWPEVKLQLTMDGVVVRNSNNDVALRSESHIFRTCGQGKKKA